MIPDILAENHAPNPNKKEQLALLHRVSIMEPKTFLTVRREALTFAA
ncbi:MAG TPA: hypothetical protein VFB72_05280 [Verrucomicrobiae bacterium]|nr:hypothetical protein [Verrucomicrobiae bacterium]